jgi:hypothetical protein
MGVLCAGLRQLLFNGLQPVKGVTITLPTTPDCKHDNYTPEQVRWASGSRCSNHHTLHMHAQPGGLDCQPGVKTFLYRVTNSVGHTCRAGVRGLTLSWRIQVMRITYMSNHQISGGFCWQPALPSMASEPDCASKKSLVIHVNFCMFCCLRLPCYPARSAPCLATCWSLQQARPARWAACSTCAKRLCLIMF